MKTPGTREWGSAVTAGLYRVYRERVGSVLRREGGEKGPCTAAVHLTDEKRLCRVRCQIFSPRARGWGVRLGAGPHLAREWIHRWLAGVDSFFGCKGGSSSAHGNASVRNGQARPGANETGRADATAPRLRARDDRADDSFGDSPQRAGCGRRGVCLWMRGGDLKSTAAYIPGRRVARAGRWHADELRPFLNQRATICTTGTGAADPINRREFSHMRPINPREFPRVVSKNL